MGTGFIAAAKSQYSMRRKSIAGRARTDLQARTIDVTRSDDEVTPITTAGGGTRSRGGKNLITEGIANIGPTAVPCSGDMALGDITVACAMRDAIEPATRPLCLVAGQVCSVRS